MSIYAVDAEEAMQSFDTCYNFESKIFENTLFLYNYWVLERTFTYIIANVFMHALPSIFGLYHFRRLIDARMLWVVV